MSGRSKERQTFSDSLEFRLSGTPKMIHEIIDKSALPGWSYKGRRFKVREAESETSNTFLRLNVLGVDDTSSKQPIGVLTLQSLPDNQVLLRVPPRSQWIPGFTSEEKIKMGLAEMDGDTQYYEYFEALIKHLEGEFKRQGILITRWQRMVGWIKAHRLLWAVIIPLSGLAITLLGNNWQLVLENVTKFLGLLGLGS